MNKEEVLKLYDEIGSYFISELYRYSCLRLAGFDKDVAYDLTYLLGDLYIADETNTSISRLADLLYEKIDDLDINKLTPREILVKIL